MGHLPGPLGSATRESVEAYLLDPNSNLRYKWRHMSSTSMPSDPRFKRILENVPREVLMKLATSQRQHDPEKLSKDKETLLAEVFRTCSAQTIATLYDDYPAPANFTVWFFELQDTLSRSAFNAALTEKVPPKVRTGITLQYLSEDPELYQMEEAASGALFRFAAKDGKQNLATEFGERVPVELVNYYTTTVHFSEPSIAVFGPYGRGKAVSIADALLNVLGLKSGVELMAPSRGGSREFYNQVKKTLGAFLVETKRLDPAGNYKTIAWQSRTKQPDLEAVADFKKSHLNADSMYDVLQFTCQNKLGLGETTHVKFGYPLGRFTFKHETSMSAIFYFEDCIRALLQ